MDETNNRLGRHFSKLTALQVEEAVALYKCGISLVKLAKKYKVSHVNLIKLLDARGVERRPKGRKKKEIKEETHKHEFNRTVVKGYYTTVWIQHPNGVQSSYRFKTTEVKKRTAYLLSHEGVVIIRNPYLRPESITQSNLYDN